MCSIVGHSGRREAAALLLEGLSGWIRRRPARALAAVTGNVFFGAAGGNH
jgi:hypothetical protein